MSKASEKNLERKLREKIKNQGGLALKFVSPSYTGVPDRIVLLPKGNISFVELKSEGKKPTPIQLSVHKQLRKLGFRVYVISTELELEQFLMEVV